MSIVTNLKCTLAVTAGLCSSFAYAQKHPHVILIMTDQQRGDALGCMGNEAVISPNLDRLAGEGTLFMNGYSSCPSSTPARAGMLTGLSPWHHGLLGYGEVSPEYKYEMPQMMKDAGYYTFGIGKMHWHPQRIKHGFEGTLLDESGRIEDPNFTSDYRQWFQIQAPGKNPDETGIGWNDHSASNYKLPENLHPTYWTGEMACQLIQNYDNSEKPLFLKVSFARPHSPYDPPQRYIDMYKDAQVPDPFIGDWCGKWAKELAPEKAAKDAPYGNFGNEYARNSKRYYYANITFIDEQIGRVIKALKEKGWLSGIMQNEAMMSPEERMIYETFGGRDTIIKNLMKQFDSEGDLLNANGVAGMDVTGKGTSWQQLTSVSEEYRQKMFDNVKKEFIQENGLSNGDTTKRSDIFKDYQLSVSKDKRLSGTWTLEQYEGQYRAAMYAAVKSANPNWKPGQKFDTSILDNVTRESVESTLVKNGNRLVRNSIDVSV